MRVRVAAHTRPCGCLRQRIPKPPARRIASDQIAGECLVPRSSRGHLKVHYVLTRAIDCFLAAWPAYLGARSASRRKATHESLPESLQRKRPILETPRPVHHAAERVRDQETRAYSRPALQQCPASPRPRGPEPAPSASPLSEPA